MYKLTITNNEADYIYKNDKNFIFLNSDYCVQRGEEFVFGVVENDVEVEHPINNKIYAITYIYYGKPVASDKVLICFSKSENSNNTEYENIPFPEEQ